ncbi:MAG: HAD family hydrolase [Deltaproteobacteria bacterium]|nr:HAD family hydrolase [Deltaproteobacteria bacterium]
MRFKKKPPGPEKAAIDIRTRMPGVFVDRDGTLIRDVGYLRRVEQLEVLPRVPEALQLLHRHRLKVAVITNQSAVARGFLSERELQEIHDHLKEQLGRQGGSVDGIYYCPHHPTEGAESYRISCECRKPKVGLIERAALELELDPARSYMVGDQAIDMEVAERVGAKGIRIDKMQADSNDRETKGAIPVVKDLWEAAQWIIGDLERTLKAV